MNAGNWSGRFKDDDPKLFSLISTCEIPTFRRPEEWDEAGDR